MDILYTSGEVHLAYSVVGSGSEALVVVPGWVSHLRFDWETPEIRAYYERLGKGRRLVRYDKRGTGLSDRSVGPEGYSPAVQAGDLERVIHAAHLDRAAILGWSEGGPIAIEFAAQHPDRVSGLVLYGTYPRLLPGDGYPHGRARDRAEALMGIVAAEWGLGSRVLSDVFVPESDPGRLSWFTEYQRVSTTAQVAADYLAAAYRIDVRDRLDGLACPVLVAHRRDDRVIPVGHGRYLAGHIPGAAWAELEGDHHLPYFGDSSAVVGAVDEFLSGSDTAQPELSAREVEVLRLVAEGLPNRDVAARLNVSSATIARHLANIYQKLGVSSRAGAAAFALRRGLV